MGFYPLKYCMRMRNGGAARPAGRMQDQHVVDRASARATCTDAVESWGVSDAARFKNSLDFLTLFYTVCPVRWLHLYAFFTRFVLFT